MDVRSFTHQMNAYQRRKMKNFVHLNQKIGQFHKQYLMCWNTDLDYWFLQKIKCKVSGTEQCVDQIFFLLLSYKLNNPKNFIVV
jgi:hypothetical protein